MKTNEIAGENEKIHCNMYVHNISLSIVARRLGQSSV